MPSLLLLPLLSGCVTQAPLRLLTEAELRPYYVDGPTQPLPEYTAFTLGESYQPGGTVADWKTTKAVSLYSRVDRNLVPAAQLQPDGHITGAALLKPGATEALQFTLSMGDQNAWQSGSCVVDGLKATAGVNVFLPEVTAFILRLSDLQQSIQPLTSPAPTERVINHDLRAYDTPLTRAQSRLVYVSEDVTVKGEQRCIRGFEQDHRISVAQDNIRVNLKLHRGWNALIRASTYSFGDKTIVSDIIWTTVPHEIVERWR